MSVPCPCCKVPTKITYNWFQIPSTGEWGHECWECENVFLTEEKVTTRVNSITTDSPTFKKGVGGNYYVFCTIKEPLEDICGNIGKSVESIYYHDKHECWVFRVRAPHHKRALDALFK